jgi:hypothetical protein
MHQDKTSSGAVDVTVPAQPMTLAGIRSEIQNQIHQVKKLIRDCDLNQAGYEKARGLTTDDRLLIEKLQAVLMDFSFSC